MTDKTPIWILMTTYHRAEVAIKTIQGIKENLAWDNIGWIIEDDGTGDDHLKKLRDEIGGTYSVETYDSGHKGVGYNMNHGLRRIWEMGAELTLILEDDWYLDKPFDPTPAVNVLMNHADVGMVRYGYYSPGIKTEIISLEEHLWHHFVQGSDTYVYTGHASLRHRRLHEVVGMFAEGLAPGANELSYCHKYNTANNPPMILWDADFGRIGPFVHIGTESLSDVRPNL